MSEANGAATPQSLIREELLALSAYHVPASAGMVKLDAMENPYPLPDDLAAGLGALLGAAPVNRYPEADARALKASIRRALDVPAGCDILLGNGSDEIIQLLAMAVAKPGAVLASVEPTFVMFRMIARSAQSALCHSPAACSDAVDATTSCRRSPTTTTTAGRSQQ